MTTHTIQRYSHYIRVHRQFVDKVVSDGFLSCEIYTNVRQFETNVLHLLNRPPQADGEHELIRLNTAEFWRLDLFPGLINQNAGRPRGNSWINTLPSAIIGFLEGKSWEITVTLDLF